MDNFEFTVGMTQALAWPVTLLIVFLVLRRPISRAIGRMRSVKHGEVELAFEEELEDVTQAASEAAITIFRPASSFKPELRNMIFEDPRSAVLEGWKPLRAQLQRLCESAALPWDNENSAIKALRKQSDMRASEWDVVEELLAMRNKAAHGVDDQISSADAQQFAMISQSMTERLEQSSVKA